MGVEDTLIVTALCNRATAGIDLNQDYIDAYHVAVLEHSLQNFSAECGDCLAILNDKSKMISLTDGKPISLLLFDPPYSNMVSKEKTESDIAVYGKTATPFSNSEHNFGNMDQPLFLSKLKESVKLVLPYIKS